MDAVIPVVFPPLCVQFENKLSAEELEALKGRGGAILGKENMITFGGQSVDKDLLAFLYRHNKKVKTRCPTPAGTANMSQIQGFLKVLTIVTWFLKTHVYPAFSGPLPDDSTGGGAIDTIPGFITAKRKGLFGDRLAKRARIAERPADEDEDMEDQYEDGMEEFNFGDADNRVPKARPSTLPTHIFGLATQMPTLPGLVFPYFPDILDTDTNFVSSVIRTYFLECLGDTRDTVLSGFKDVKGAMGTIAQTQTGKVLQHIFCGVQLAIQAQARLYLLISDGRYMGFTLHGWYFTVSIDSYKRVPVSHEELVTAVKLVDEHNVAVAQILSKLSKMKTGGRLPTKKYLDERKPIVAKNPRELAELLRQFDLSDIEDREEIEKLANKLSFPQRFWEFSPEKILAAVDLLLAKSFPAVDLPLYVRGGTLTTTDPALSIFGLFGESGFSFRTPGGVAIKVPKDQGEDTLYKPYRGKNNKEIKPNPTLVVSKRSLGLCVEDWHAFTADHRFHNKNTRDQAFRSVAFGGPKGKELWNGLIDRVGVLAEDIGIEVSADDIELGTDGLGGTKDNFEDFL